MDQVHGPFIFTTPKNTGMNNNKTIKRIKDYLNWNKKNELMVIFQINIKIYTLFLDY